MSSCVAIVFVAVVVHLMHLVFKFLVQPIGEFEFGIGDIIVVEFVGVPLSPAESELLVEICFFLFGDVGVVLFLGLIEILEATGETVVLLDAEFLVEGGDDVLGGLQLDYVGFYRHPQ